MRRKVKNRNQVSPDRKYLSTDVSKFINYIMWAGKKSIAESIVYEALEKLEKATNTPALDAFKRL
jgi:small subunit ribosomal protein S7